MALGEDQKEFIKNKVKELGSVKKVVDFYHKECAVSKYAFVYAVKIFDKKKKKSK